MIIGQLAPVPTNEFAAVVVSLAALAGIALIIKNLFFNKSLAEQPVTRLEYDKLRDKIEKCERDCVDKTQFNELKALCATKDTVDRLTEDINKLHDYMHERHHKLAGDMNLLQLSIEKIHLEIHKENEMNNKLIIDKIDNVVKLIFDTSRQRTEELKSNG